jgi:hypothetical protein
MLGISSKIGGFPIIGEAFKRKIRNLNKINSKKGENRIEVRFALRMKSHIRSGGAGERIIFSILIYF